MSTDKLRMIIAERLSAVGEVASIAAAMDARLGASLEGRLAAPVNDVLQALDVTLDDATPGELRALLGEIRTIMLANEKLMFASSRGPGWAHRETELLTAAGDVSTAFAAALANMIAAKLDGLADRLAADGAAFLDVGVGVAALSIEIARRWPGLRIVGIDSWAPSIALAHEAVRSAGLEHRITIREQAGENLPDVDAFDLAWVPSVFVPASAIEEVVRRVHRALRPGGWLLLATTKQTGDARSDAVARLRTVMFGGDATLSGDALLRDAGFVDVRNLPSPPTAAAAMVAARKQP